MMPGEGEKAGYFGIDYGFLGQHHGRFPDSCPTHPIEWIIASSLESLARSIVQRLQRAGFTALYAGGCVGDRLLRRRSGTIMNIATDARPDQVQALFPRSIAIGAHFGVISVLEGGGGVSGGVVCADGIYLDGPPSGERHVFNTGRRTPNGAISRLMGCS